jgi:hypothetical protein
MSAIYREILVFLRKRPAFITKPIYDALISAGHNKIAEVIVWAVDEHGNIVPRIANAQDNTRELSVPHANLEKYVWNIQALTVDKMLMIVQSITPKDIQKSNLGMKSKAIRDLGALFHMLRLQNKNPNLALVNVNIGDVGAGDKLKALTAYVQKNRES